MSLSTLIIVLVIVFAFLVFAVTLAWGDYQTSRLSRQSAKKGDPASSTQTSTAAGL